MGYTQTRRPELLDRMKVEGAAANRRLNDYKIACAGDPTRDLVQIDTRYETLRASTLAILRLDQEYVDHYETFVNRRDAFERVVRKDVLPLLKLGSSRVYAKRKALENAEQILSRGTSSAKRMEELDRVKKQLLERYEQAYADLEEALGGAEVNPSDSRHISWPWAVALILGIILFGFGALAIDRTLKKQFLLPIAHIASIAEAAAAGDLSREIDLWRRDEVGSLAQSINRLLSVLARSENLVYHLATLVESSGDAIISQSLDGTVLSWNKGAQRIYGYSAEEVKGQNISLLSPADEGKQLHKVLEKIQQGEPVTPFEMKHVAKNGRTVNVFIRVAAVHDSTKKVIGVSFCAEDLSLPRSSPNSRDERPELPAQAA